MTTTKTLLQVSINERYREAGFLRRQYCQSRATILSVSLTAIFAGGWLLIAEESLSHWGRLFVLVFCICLYVISVLSTFYFSKRIQLVTKVLQSLEKGTYKDLNELDVHSNLNLRLKKQPFRWDLFDICVNIIGLFAIALSLIIYTQAITATVSAV